MDPALVRVSGPAMGSLFEIYVGHEDAEEAERLARAALRRVEWLEQKLSHFLPDSDIWRINAAAAREPVPIAGPTMDLLRRLRRLYEETEAAFDCTAGKLVRALGFFRRGEQRSTSGSSLDASEVAAIVAAIGWRNVELNTDGNTVRFLTPL